MPILHLSLRTKSLLALVGACLMALIPTMWIGWEILERGRDQLGQAYAQNFTLLSAQRIEAPVTRELALAQRFGDSLLLRQWLMDENSDSKMARFFQEADGYQKALQGGNYFVVNRESLAYYFNGPEKIYSQEPRYYLDPENPDDEWFFTTMEDFDTFTINVNPDVHLGNVQVWIDVMVWNDDKKIGMAGTGLELSQFLEEFIAADESGVTPMILDAKGLIQAHPDESLIAYGSGAEADTKKSDHEQSSLQNEFTDSSDSKKLTQAMQSSQKNPNNVETFWAELDGKKQLLALTWIPELSWHVVSAVDLQTAQILDGKWIIAAIAAMVIMFGILLLVFGYGVEKLVLRPLGTLHQSATALASGEYNVSLPSGGRDEIGDLSRAFAGMVEEIKNHTNELEAKVRERTSELENQSVLLQQAKESAENAHQSKTQILNKVMESIHYAKTIQQAILTREMDMAAFVPDCFTVWKPKDVISGDLIWGMPLEDGFAAAVIDCTGHGVPGGLMTMAAFSSLNSIVGRIGMHNPGRVLQEVSRNVQEKLCNQDKSTFAEDGLDMGLCVYQRSSSTLLFSGARLSLFYTYGSELVEIKGDRESLGYRSSNPDFLFQNHVLEVNGHLTCYLTTDGIIDQVGAENGLPFGKRRWLSFLNSIRTRSMPEQKQALLEMCEAFQGQEEQRDDITVLGFRLTAGTDNPL
ncbi:MAG: biofilm regulation protein phosphatase SiaA [Thermodesulfobacteriota bacterium]